MRITRVFHDSPLSVGETLRLGAEEAHHVQKVLRGRPGDEIEVVDGEGGLFLAELAGGPEVVLVEERPAAIAADDGSVTLYQAVPKGRHMDLVVEKATELGVGRIVPLLTERGIVKLSRGNRGDGKADRWRRMALSAARQSLRLRVPEVGEPVAFAEAARGAEEAGVLLHVGPDLPPVEETVAGGPVGLFVGPEGGWDEGELALAAEAGLRFASLGPFRLRSETAGVVAVARARAVLEQRRERSVARSR